MQYCSQPFFLFPDLFRVILQPRYRALFISLFQVGIINLLIVTLFMTERCLPATDIVCPACSKKRKPLKISSESDHCIVVTLRGEFSFFS